MQVWVGVSGAVVCALVALAVGPVLTSWGSGVEVRLPVVATTVTAAAAGFAVAGRIGLKPALPAYGVLAIGAAVLVAVDLRLHRLPDRLTLSTAGTGVVLLAVAAATTSAWSGLGRSVLGGLALLTTYLVLYLVARSGLGAGDVKLAGMLGLFLGWLGWPALVLGAVAGFLVGGLGSLALVLARRATLATRVPFGPSMVAGALVAIAIGNARAASILGW